MSRITMRLVLALALACAAAAQQTLPFPIHVDTTGGALGTLGAAWTRLPAAASANVSTEEQLQQLSAASIEDSQLEKVAEPTEQLPPEETQLPAAPAPADEAEQLDEGADTVTPIYGSDEAASASLRAPAASLSTGYIVEGGQAPAEVGRHEPSLAVDVNGNKVVVVWAEGSGTARYAFSSNSGRTWSKAAPLPPPAGYATLTAPRVTGPVAGRYYGAAVATTATGDSTLAVLDGRPTASSGTGYTWNKARALPGPGACLRWQRPSISVARDNSGFLVLAAQEVSAADAAACRRMPEVSRLVGFISRDAGRTWSEPVTLVDSWRLPANGSYVVATGAPSVVVSSSTTAHVFLALSARDLTLPSSTPLALDTVASTAWLAMVKTSNKGAKWSAPTVLRSFNNPQLAAPAGFDGALLPIAPSAVASPYTPPPASSKKPGQVLYVAYTSAVAPVGAGVLKKKACASGAPTGAWCFEQVATSTQVLVTSSSDGGASWSSPKPVGAALPTKNVKQFMPALAVDTTSSSNSVAVTYYQSVETSGSACLRQLATSGGEQALVRTSNLRSLVDAYTATSYDGGASFSSATKLSSASTNLCSLRSNASPSLGLGVSGNNAKVFAAFTDAGGSATTPALRFASTSAAGTPPPPPEKPPPEGAALHILSVGRSVCADLASAPPCGTNAAELAATDDGSSRQRWVFKPVAGKAKAYTVQLQGRTGCGQYLSAAAACDTTGVTLVQRDTGNGLQQWQVLHQGSDVYVLQSAARSSCPARLLAAPSCSSGSEALVLTASVAGGATNLQRWKFNLLPPPEVNGIHSTMFTVFNTSGASGRRGAVPYANPVMPWQFMADPGVLRAPNGKYYMYATPVGTCWESSDLVNWAARGPGFGAGPGMGAGQFWAPEIYQKNGIFYLFYAALAPGGPHHIYVARAADPCGPWAYHAGPLGFGGMIDPHYFRDDNGKEYLYASGIGVGIYMWDISPDLKILSNQQFVFSHASMPEAWVPEIINEGPIVLKRKGVYYLVYSGNGCCNNILYGLGYATAPTPRGPWTKSRYNPILWKTANTVGTGHNSFAISPSGNLVSIYHIINGMVTTDDRRLAVDLTWFEKDPAGGPDILRIGGPTRTAQPGL